MYLCFVNFISRNSIPTNIIPKNNILGNDILGVFSMQIEFSGIFNKFPKIPLMEAATAGRPTAEGG